jgi:integration host factor subunit beta
MPRSRSLTRAELIEEVSRAAELQKREASSVVDAVLKAIAAALRRGEVVELRGFGSFRYRQRAARLGRNPKTGAPVEVPAKRIPFFRPGKKLRLRLNPPHH